MKYLLIIAALSVISHLSYLTGGFTWLDHGDIEQRLAILPLPHLLSAFTMPYGATGFYRPLITIINSLDASVWQNQPIGFHLTNIIFHIGVGILTFFIAQRLFALSRPLALVAAIITAIHPLSWLPIGVITYRPELISTLFTWLSLLLYVQYMSHNRLVYLLFFSISVVLALFSKESALFWVPAFIASWELTQRLRSHTRGRIHAHLALYSIIVLYLALRSHALLQWWKTQAGTLSLSEAIGTRLSLVPRYQRHFIDPTYQPISDATTIVPWYHLWSLVGIVILLGFILLFWKKRSVRGRLLLFACGILPAFSLLPVPRFFSLHYVYVVLPIVAVLMVDMGSWLYRFVWTKYAVTILMGIYLVVMAGYTFSLGYRTQNDRTLFTKEVTRDPRFHEGWFYLADYYRLHGQQSRARQAYLQALQPDPGVIAYVDTIAARINFASLLYVQKKYDEAQQLLTDALTEADGRNREIATYNLALIAFEKKDCTRGMSLLQNDIIKWHTPEPYVLLARCYELLDMPVEADETLRKAKPFLSKEAQGQLELILSGP